MLGVVGRDATGRGIIKRLRVDGFTVRSVFEESAGIDDPHVLSVAHKAGLILITQDHDFGELAVSSHKLRPRREVP